MPAFTLTSSPTTSVEITSSALSVPCQPLLVSQTFWGPSPKLHSTLCQVGKRRGQSLVATNVTGLQPSRLFLSQTVTQAYGSSSTRVRSPLCPLPASAGITDVLGTEPETALRLVPSRETTRPVVSGDERHWPTTKSPFFISDCYTGLRFLIDTGAQVSVLPPSPEDRKHPRSDLTLQAVNNTPIRMFGTRSLTLNLGLHRTFRWVFVVAETTTPILGADFLRHFGLLVDLKHNRLADTTTNLVVQGIVSQGISLSPPQKAS